MDAQLNTRVRRSRGRPSSDKVEIIETELLGAALRHFVRDGYGGASVGKIVKELAAFIAECAVRDGVPCQDPTGIAASFIFMLRGWYVNVMLTNEPVTKAAMGRFAAQAVRAMVSSRCGW